MSFKLNENDKKLLEFCKGRPKSVREVANHLGIAPKNVSIRLENLEKAGLLTLGKYERGKARKLKTREDKKTKEYTYNILKALEKAGGSLSLKEFHSLIPFEIGEEGYDKFRSTLNVEYSDLVEHVIRLSEEGKKFLKENANRTTRKD